MYGSFASSSADGFWEGFAGFCFFGGTWCSVLCVKRSLLKVKEGVRCVGSGVG